MNERETGSEAIGYLVPSNTQYRLAVVGKCCAVTSESGNTYDRRSMRDTEGPELSALVSENVVEVYPVNIGDYFQDCAMCGRRLHEGKPGWPELFDGRLKRNS